jgi:ABC-type antimicrobial peptide transport system permease subunit
MSDLALGVRLAVGGGRTSWARFALSTFGIAIAVTVLLVSASIGTMVTEYQARNSVNAMADNERVPGVDPLYMQSGDTEFRGEPVKIVYAYAEGENVPVPRGVRELPGPGEIVASPGLAELLGSDDGKLLRPRLPGPVVEVLDTSAVPERGELIAYVGGDADLVHNENAAPVYKFGVEETSYQLSAPLLLLILVGAVVLLLPVFIFVASASRIAGAERDRRLSALRLVGSGSRQVRRIAAAESLVSAVAGLVLGGAAFLVLRSFADEVELFDLRVYQSDVVPDPTLAALIVLAIPALAVLTALFALRRTIIEPLGVVRRAKPVRRRLWWRLGLVLVGVALLVTQGGAEENSDAFSVAISMGAVLLLVGVPVLLPWLVERVAGRIQGGPSSWMLAIRRLQLDSGTSARVVGGVAVVLAGAIALQTVLATVEDEVGLPGTQPGAAPRVEVSGDAELIEDVAADLAEVPTVRAAHVVNSAAGYAPGAAADSGGEQYLNVMDCAAVTDLVGVEDCTDGQVFAMDGMENMGQVARPGQRMEFREYPANSVEWDADDYETVGSWTVPDDIRRVPAQEEPAVYGTLIVTPGAMGDLGVLPSGGAAVRAMVGDDLTSDQLEELRNAVASYGPDIYVYSFNTAQDLNTGQRMFVAIRNALYGGSVFTLLLAGLSLLVLALEHIRERRRPLAILAATGVQRGVLARSLLWQVALPIAIGVLVAVLTGVGLAWLILRLSDEPLSVDWAGTGLLSGGAVLLSLLVTAMTLPFLRSATRLTSLRTE